MNVWIQQGNASDLNNATKMNVWISEKLTKMVNNSVYELPPLIVPAGPHENRSFPIPDYFQNDGHFIPQYDYVYDGNRRVVDHVLHFEQLDVEFPQLMKAYNLSIHLSGLKHGEKDNENNMQGKQSVEPKSKLKMVGQYNLTRVTLRFIERVYARDFETFGYQMIS